MKLWQSLVGKSEVGERFTVPDAGMGYFMSSYGAPDNERILPGFQNSVDAYQNSGVVFGVLLARLQLFSEAEFKFQGLADKKLYGTAALAKLQRPWPGGTTGELLARMEQDASLAGNAFIRDAGTQLERLRPDWVTIVSELFRDPITDTEIRKVVGYWYDPPVTEGREPAFYPVDEVAHWSPIPDPLASFRGMSWLTPVLREIDADLQMTDYKRAYLENAASPNMLIRYEQKIGPDRITRLTDQIRAKHAGPRNAFRTLILDEGADVTLLGHNMEQMKFREVQGAGETRIAAAAGVPPVIVGLSEGLAAATYSNYGMAMRRFADLYGRPSWRSACAALAKLIEVPSGSRLWYDTNDIAALQEGEKERADTMAVLATAAAALISAGYEPKSISASLSATDITLLKHTGMVSVQLQTPGAAPTPPATAPTPEEGT